MLDLFQDITIGVLFGPAVNPNELAPFVDAKLGEITAAAVDFSNPFQMRLLGMKSSWQTGVKISRENRPNQTSKHEISEMIVANTDAMYRLHQIEKHFSPEFIRTQKMLDHKREIFRQPVLSSDEPTLAAKPRHPLAVLRLRRVNPPSECMPDEGDLSDSLYGFSG